MWAYGIYSSTFMPNLTTFQTFTNIVERTYKYIPVQELTKMLYFFAKFEWYCKLQLPFLRRVTSHI